MSKVSRYDKDKKLLYQHEYTKFDLNYHVKEEKLPFYFGIAKTCRDFMERPISLETPFHNIGLCFNPANLVIKKINSLFGDKDYSYDNLNQLTKEGEINYDFDSLGNPKEYEINNLNQIVSNGQEEFCYDNNGNLIKHNDSVYSYDALNRLIKIVHQHRKIIYFTYDPLSRLVSKNDDFYLYDGEFEIGKINKKGEILELKVLGLGVKGDMGASIMLEFGGRQFIPLHDLQGNMIALLSRVQNIVETYDFNAFGETKRTIYLNPWRFGSKREEEGLLFFGKRFYSPKLKRWLSPDPLGFKDSRNLYQFVLNDPLNRLDQFGLEVELYFHTDHYKYYKKYEHELPYSMDQYRSSIMDRQTSVEHRGNANVFDQTMYISMICSRNYSFNFTDEEKSLGYFNIFSHIPELLDGAENQIAIVSYMNGMNCPISDWQSMNYSIAGDLPQGVFFMGLYNKTNGLYSDSKRAWKEKLGTPMQSAYNLSRYFMEIKKHMSATCPTAKVLHICHSEGGAIYNLAFKLLCPDDQAWVRDNVHVLAFGPLECIPKDHGLDPINFYSKNDMITGWFAETDLEKYNVKWLNVTYGLVNKVRETFPAHEFGGKIYQQALKGEIDKLKSTVGFYVGNKR
jgi:RHS repeat-associated protein